MELYHLRTFIKVAEEKNLTRAAKKLFTSPPTISAHIKALEEELNVSLFTRSSKGMTLTSAGEALKKKADHILSAVKDFIGSAHRLRHEPSGKIRFGLNFPSERFRVSDLLRLLNKHYPRVVIELTSSSTGGITEAILNHTLDVGCIYGTPSSKLLSAHRLCTVELVVAAPANWADRIRNAEWEDVAELPWIRDTHHCPFQNLADDLFKNRGLTLNRLVTSDEDATRLELVKGGIGLSVLERQFAAISDQIVIWETDQPLYIELSIAYLKSRADEPKIRAVTAQVMSFWQTEPNILKMV